MFNVGYSKLFKDLPNENIFSTTIGSNSLNIKKNRYKSILPFDQNRVCLKASKGSNEDYINASYIKGYPEEPEKFIACQAPIRETMRDHWKMIFDHKIIVAVMLTQLDQSIENAVEAYWPKKKGASVVYKDMRVTLLDEKTFNHFDCRELTVTCESDPEITHHLTHLHFTSWIDKSIPVHTYTLLALMRRARKVAATSNAPILVHCSAGVGRTGSYLAIENLIEQARMEKQVSVFECVKKLRHQRMRTVETEQQYKFVHDAILDVVLQGDCGYDNELFVRRFPDLQTVYMDAKFEALERLRIFDRISTGKSTKNESENGDNNSGDYSTSGPPSSDFSGEYDTTAVCDSYYTKNSYILTAPTTLEDFWYMILEERIEAVILLDQVSTSLLPPSNEEISIGCHVLVDEPIEQEGDEVKIQMTRVYENNSLIGGVSVYSLRDEVWPAETYLPRSTSFIFELHKLVTNKREKLVFQCLDGWTRSGLIASAFHLLDRIECEQIVDPLLATRFTVQCSPRAVINKKQFSFLYQVAYDYLNQNLSAYIPY